MPRCPILAVYPDGSKFRVTAAEAKEIVVDGLGEWDGKKSLRMKTQGRSGGRLSRQVGAPMASAALRGEGWARVAVAEALRTK